MNKERKNCLICGRSPNNKINFGTYHLSMSLCDKTKYINESAKNPKYRYVMSECKQCGFFWLNFDHPNVDDEKNYDLRISSNEPEKHFDDLINWFSDFDFFNENIKIGLLSYKDKSLLEKINLKCYQKEFIWEESKDLLEISKILIKKSYLKKIETNYKYNFIIGRHILEHVSNPEFLIKYIESYLENNGIIYFEVPSPSYMMREGLSYFLWEEHPSYFTTKSLKHLLDKLGFISYFKTFENGKEPIISMILSKKELKCNEVNQITLSDEDLSINIFNKKHIINKEKINKFLQNKAFKNLYFLGAGHLGIKAVCFYELTNYLDGFIDDMEIKQNKISMACGLKIFNSSQIEKNSNLLHVLPPESIANVKRNPLYSSHNLISLSDVL